MAEGRAQLVFHTKLEVSENIQVIVMKLSSFLLPSLSKFGDFHQVKKIVLKLFGQSLGSADLNRRSCARMLSLTWFCWLRVQSLALSFMFMKGPLLYCNEICLEIRIKEGLKKWWPRTRRTLFPEQVLLFLVGHF